MVDELGVSTTWNNLFHRALVRYQEPISDIALYVLGDASGLHVAAVAFNIVSHTSGITQGIVVAKARLAKQGLTIPHLELVTGHMAANVAANVGEALHGYPVNKVDCWSDSTVTLHYIREVDYKQFVHNRMQKIQERMRIKWRYVPTKKNPAALASSRGQVAQENDLWLYPMHNHQQGIYQRTGPKALHHSKSMPSIKLDRSSTRSKGRKKEKHALHCPHGLTRGLFLQLLPDLTTEEFVGSLKPLVAR